MKVSRKKLRQIILEGLPKLSAKDKKGARTELGYIVGAEHGGHGLWPLLGLKAFTPAPYIKTRQNMKTPEYADEYALPSDELPPEEEEKVDAPTWPVVDIEDYESSDDLEIQSKSTWKEGNIRLTRSQLKRLINEIINIDLKSSVSDSKAMAALSTAEDLAKYAARKQNRESSWSNSIIDNLEYAYKHYSTFADDPTAWDRHINQLWNYPHFRSWYYSLKNPEPFIKSERYDQLSPELDTELSKLASDYSGGSGSTPRQYSALDPNYPRA